MILLIDVGNTRIKWATLTDLRLTQQQAAVYSSWDGQQLREHLLTKVRKPSHVLIANVGGEKIANLLTEGIAKAWAITPEFIHSTSTAVQVRNAYGTPANLGVDRWLAVIAAYHLERRLACVVSVGTAMTIDGVDASGQHLGGIIVPGPELMIDSLMRHTSDIADRASDGMEGTDIFADNTRGAIYQGASHTLAAIVERACNDLQIKFGQMPALLITGGASGRVTDALRVPFRLVPDLVLRGLAELARGASAEQISVNESA